MESWLSHTLTGIGSLIAGAILPFILKWRKQERQQDISDWQALFKQATEDRALQNARIEVLEKRIDGLQKDHISCLEVQAELRAKIALLEQAGKK